MEPKANYEIYYNSSMDAVIMNWAGYSNSKELREGTEKMLHVLTESKAQKVLANIKDMILISMEDQNWIEHNFLPRAIAAGFKAIAIIKPASYFNNVAIETISSKLEKRELIQIERFESYDDAADWLSQVNLG